MAQRGRKSAAKQAVLSLVDVGEYRPPPPDELSPEQGQVWTDIVASMKPRSFVPATYPLLAAYCCAVCQRRDIADQLRKIDPKKDFEQYRALVNLQRGLTATMCSLATKLRLLPKCNTRADSQLTSSTGRPVWELRRPWEDAPDSDDEETEQTEQ